MSNQNKKVTHVALAILYQQRKFLMQLRDPIPTIAYPGHWGLFGGHIEAGETPEMCLQREIKEEINYKIDSAIKFCCYTGRNIVRHIYYAPLSVSVEQLNLQEGWDLDLVALEAIKSGSYYSSKAGRSQPIGLTHQQILLHFVQVYGASIEAKLNDKGQINLTA